MAPKLSRDTRKEKRTRARLLVKYQTSSTAQFTRITNVKNVSQGGICFLTNERLAIGSIVKLSILIPPREKPIEAEVSVVQATQSGKSSMAFSIGAKFIKVAERDQNAMQHFLKGLSRAKRSPLFVDIPGFVVRKN